MTSKTRRRSKNDKKGLRSLPAKRRRKLRAKVLERYNHKCAQCGKGQDQVELTIDHIIPVTLDGKNILSNLRVLCRLCNEKKGLKENKHGAGQQNKNHK